MEYSINSKTADLGRTPHLLRPFNLWSVGDLKRLEKGGLSLFSRRAREREELTLEEAVALVTYVVNQANPQITAADVDSMDPDTWAGLFSQITQHMFPEQKPEETKSDPLVSPDGLGEAPSS